MFLPASLMPTPQPGRRKAGKGYCSVLRAYERQQRNRNLASEQDMYCVCMYGRTYQGIQTHKMSEFLMLAQKILSNRAEYAVFLAPGKRLSVRRISAKIAEGRDLTVSGTEYSVHTSLFF